MIKNIDDAKGIKQARLPRRALLVIPVFAALLIAAGAMNHSSKGAVAMEQFHTSSSGSTTRVVAEPKRLVIPSLDIDIELVSVGVNTLGEMDVPKEAAIPGWYRGGVRPGEKGKSVIAGHFDSVFGTPGVFANLNKLKEGDEITVEDVAGNTFRFKVKKSAMYGTANAPAQEIFGRADNAQLQLITCSGTWIREKNSYDKRLVVFTELIP